MAKKNKSEKKSDRKRTSVTGQSASKIQKRQSIRSPLDGVSVKRPVSRSASPSSKSKATGKKVEPKKNQVVIESSDEGENKIASESNASPKSGKSILFLFLENDTDHQKRLKIRLQGTQMESIPRNHLLI